MHQDRLTGTVGQSVLLPAFYTNSDSGGYLRITWTKTGTRIVDFRCPSDRKGNFVGCTQAVPIPDHYKYRAVLFPENASLLMRDLQISDSGIYELSISHSRGTEKSTLKLTVQPSDRMDAVTLTVHQDQMNGTVGQAVLLPTSYTDPDSHGYLRITWTKAGRRIADYRCPSSRNGNFAECAQTMLTDDHYKHRTVLFPENASLLLRDLQISDSGIYELSISHSAGTESRSLKLMVQPDTSNRTSWYSQKESDTDNEPSLGIGIHLRYIGLVVFVIFLYWIVKSHGGCKQTQAQTEKPNAQDQSGKLCVKDLSTSNPTE
ncbi:uncharacterized protein [Hemitrygon akajei]|uniref:uncharacterized protein n=1 Tax=Hemitrygon akajei TaxID=2704970 RepID=UPI003BF979B5